MKNEYKKKSLSTLVVAFMIAAMIPVLTSSVIGYDPGTTIDKTLSSSEGELGDTVHVTLTVNVPAGETVTVVDTLPGGFHYIVGSFMVDGVSATPTIDKHEISYTITEAGDHVIEFDVKIDEAKSWEDMEVCNIATATWYDEGGNVIEIKEDVECFIIHPFEELHKNVGIPKADVVFAIDLTGSMSGEIATIKTEATNIMNSLAAQIADVQFGLISFMDYDGTYSTAAPGSSPVTYNVQYGQTAVYGDYPYLLDQDITSDKTTMATKINALTIGWGGDGPQDYTRIVHESWNDPNLNWRTDAVRFLIMFGDNVPHDTNFDNDNDGTLENTGGDPGRNTLLGDGDDLDFETEVASAAAADVHIMSVYSGWTGEKYPWTYMADETDGGYYELIDAEDIPDAINDLIKAEAEETLTVEVGEDVQWAIVIDVVNPFGYTMGDIIIKDNFGAEIEIDDIISITHGDLDIKLKGKSEKVSLKWEIGNLAPGETARLILLVSTDLNPAGHQEYTSPGIYELNSGATLKFKETILVDTVTVDANTLTPSSSINLADGVDYILVATGTAFAGGKYTEDIEFDAKYSITHSKLGDTWTDSVTDYESYGPDLLDLFVNGDPADWGKYNADHTYTCAIAGDGSPVELLIYDIYYPNNVGSLTVEIYEVQDMQLSAYTDSIYVTALP